MRQLVIPCTDGPWNGVDVSYAQSWPERIDWVKAHQDDGILWAVVKASQGKASDSKCLRHLEAIRQTGITLGLYHYVTLAPAAEQAAAFLAMLTAGAIGPGDLCPALDVEEPARDARGEVILDAQDPRARAHYDGILDRTRAMIRALEAAGFPPWIYLSPGYFELLGHPQDLKAYPWWIAHYTTRPEPWCPWVKWSAWQWSGDRLAPWATTPEGRVTPIDRNRARELPILAEAV
jgi:GH25 family lysozyme M1 (1,4-beta-N-acetylmuramidase)